jgi:hypothetical protein
MIFFWILISVLIVILIKELYVLNKLGKQDWMHHKDQSFTPMDMQHVIKRSKPFAKPKAKRTPKTHNQDEQAWLRENDL